MADAPSQNPRTPGSPRPLSPLYSGPPGTGATSTSVASASNPPERAPYASVVSQTPLDPPATVATAAAAAAPATGSSSTYPPTTLNRLSSTQEPPLESEAQDSTMDTDSSGESSSSLSFDNYDPRLSLCPDIVGPGGTPSLYPSASRQFNNLPEKRGQVEDFFVPSYLKHSRYIERLMEDKKAKEKARMLSSGDSLGATKASTRRIVSSPGASLNLPRMTPSHRGMTYDLVENPPDDSTRGFAPLPTKMTRSGQSEMEIRADGTEVRYSGPESRNDHDAAAVRCDNPIPPQCGIYYFEIQITQKSQRAVIAIGLSSTRASLGRLPGWEQESWAYHSDDGRIFLAELQGHGKKYGPTFGEGCVVGCGIDYTTSSIFFTNQGQYLGAAFRDVRNLRLYPTVGMKKYPLAAVKVNLGQRPFAFNIDALVKKERLSLRKSILDSSPECLEPRYLDDADLLQNLVAQYLVHEGFSRTANAFAAEVSQEEQILSGTNDRKPRTYEDRAHGKNRQEIRQAILDGNIDSALSILQKHYPGVMDNVDLLFRLRCRKFIELISKMADLRANQNATDDNLYDDAVQMEEVSADASDARQRELLTEALTYGAELQDVYADEKRNARRRHLDEVFSLIAYPNPRTSVHGALLDPSNREPLFDEVNAAILASVDRAPLSALEMLYKQTETLLAMLSDDGSLGSLVNVHRDYLKLS